MASNEDILSVGAKVTLDNWSDNAQKVIDDAGQLDNLQDVSIAVSTDVDDSDITSLTSELNSLEDDYSVAVSVDDSELKSADDIHSDLDEDTSVTANVEDKELTDANSILTDIRNIEAINLAINVAGTALEFLQKLDNFTGLPALLEYDDALSTIQGRTGAMIPDAQKLIGDLYTQGWGDSRQEIADVIVTADQLGISMDDLGVATTAAFQVAAVTGDDTQTSLRTINNLAKGMGISYSEAADIIVAGTQDGANAAGDLQEALVEFGPKFAEMGLSAQGSLSIIESGLANGAKSASDVSDGVKELGTNISKIGTDEGVTAAFEQLDKISDLDLAGMLDAYNNGKLSGDQFYQGIFDGLNQANTTDPQAAKSIAGTLIGSKAEDFGVGVFATLTTQFDTAAGQIEGRATEAGTNMKDNLNTQFLEFQRTVEEFAVDFLSSEQIDLPGKIELIKSGLKDALKTLQEGGSLGDAISIGLKPIGLDDEFDRLQSIFGNLVISFLQIVADIQDFLGKDSSGTRKEVARLGTQQLGFDLKVDNPDEVAGSIQNAVDRGVSIEDVKKQVGVAVSELTKSGDIDKAQSLVDELSKGGQIKFSVTDPVARKLLTDNGQNPDFSLPISPTMSPEEIEKLKQDTINTFQQNGFNLSADVVPTVSQRDLDALQQQIDDARKAKEAAALAAAGGVATTTEGAAPAGVKQQVLADTDATTANSEAITQSTVAHTEATVAVQTTTTAVDDLAVASQDATPAVDDLSASAQDVADAAFQANLANSDLGVSMADLIAKEQALEEQYKSGAITLDQFNSSLQALIDTANANVANGGGGAPVNTTNIVTTVNTASPAENGAVGQQLANQVRGHK